MIKVDTPFKVDWVSGSDPDYYDLDSEGGADTLWNTIGGVERERASNDR